MSNIGFVGGPYVSLIAPITVISDTSSAVVRVINPTSGSTVTLLADDRAIYVGSAPLAALTIKLPAYVGVPLLVEISFSGSIDSLIIQDVNGVVVPNSPIIAYGPGSGIQMRHSGTSWVYWK